MKRIGVLALTMAVCLVLTSCSGLGINVTDSLSPPKPSGELYEIQQTLEASVGHDVKLAYPSSGEYRSAIITKDINSDGKYEVFSFYSTETDDKTTVMHLNYIRWIGEKWVSVTDLQVEASGVESVEFVKLDQSDTPKVLVNWNRYSVTDRLLSVYSIDSGELEEIAKTGYSVYSTCDFDSDGVHEIVTVFLDVEQKTSQATMFSLNNGSFEAVSGCVLDGSVTSYYTPVISELTDGTKAMFIDADKATGMITEVLYLKDGALSSAFKYTANNENVNTLRASSVRSGDYDGDGCIDIPLAQKLPTVSTSEGDISYMTTWNSFDGQEFTPIAYSIINYTDGYYINMPENWINTVAVERRLNLRQRVFYRWDALSSEIGEEILCISAVPLKDWESSKDNYEGFVEYARSSDFVYAIKFGSSALNPGEEYFINNFKLIKTDEYADTQKIV